ncbi:hypothetical protein [Anoxybacteroides tepidamans]|uniref:hypothetical protein n=1 Tax=Anoxybacteroides tepidamans TaxID=265948 RepID=UPI000A4EF025
MDNSNYLKFHHQQQMATKYSRRSPIVQKLPGIDDILPFYETAARQGIALKYGFRYNKIDELLQISKMLIYQCFFGFYRTYEELKQAKEEKKFLTIPEFLSYL